MLLKSIAASVLLLGMGPASAQAHRFSPEGREAVRTYHLQNIALERDAQRPEPQPPQQLDRRHLQESGAGGVASDGRSGSASDNVSRQGQGRMSPEERRALRRQIDEAGHDIYTPKR